MALLKYDADSNEWYRTTRFLMRSLPGEVRQNRYKTLEEAVRLNPTIPVCNPDSNDIRSLRLNDIGSGKEALSIFTESEIRAELESASKE